MSLGRVIHSLTDLVTGTPAANHRPVYHQTGGWKSIEHHVFDPRHFGARCDNSNDDTQAFLDAIDAADAHAPGKGNVLVPGASKITDQLVLNGVGLIGFGFGSRLRMTTKLGAGNAALRLIQSPIAGSAGSIYRDFSIDGPGGTTIGQDNADCDGISIEGYYPYLQNVRVSKFRKGFNFNNATGHITLYNCNAGTNWYGAWDSTRNQDHYVYRSLLNGNLRAGIGCSGDDNGLVGWRIYDSHMGYQPFAVYQETNTTGEGCEFMIGCEFDARFEGIGNAIFYSELSGALGTDAQYLGQVNQVWIRNPGHSRGNTSPDYSDHGFATTYSMVLPIITGMFVIHGEGSAILKSDTGTFRVKVGTDTDLSAIKIEDNSGFGTNEGWTNDATLVTAASGTQRYWFYPRVTAPRVKVERHLNVGLRDAVTMPAAKGARGWIVEFAEPWTLAKFACEEVSGGALGMRYLIYDANAGLTNMPILKLGANHDPGGVGVRESNLAYDGRPGRFVVLLTCSSLTPTFAGASSSNLANMQGAVETSTDVWTSPPSTLTVTRATSAINIAMRGS